MCRTLDCGQLWWRATFHWRQKCAEDYKSFISLWHHLSSRFLPSRWRVPLIHVTNSMSVFADRVEGAALRHHSSQLPFSTDGLHWYFGYPELVDWFLVLTLLCLKLRRGLCPVNRGLFQMWGVDSLFGLKQNKDTAAQKISRGSNVIFSIGKYVVVKIKYPKYRHTNKGLVASITVGSYTWV